MRAELTPDAFPQPFGKYELLKLLNRGGMAEVYLARRLARTEPLVIKRILPHLAHEPRYQEMLTAEAELAAELKHPHVVDVYELGEANDQLYIAMEYVTGSDLRILLSEGTKRGYRVPPWFSVHVACCILDALTHAWQLASTNNHSRCIVHGDVTPSNIFISEDGSVKLGDFGVAQEYVPNAPSNARPLSGKLAYLAPEQYLGHPPDHRADIFSMGVVLWEMLAQRRLFGGQPKDAIIWAVTQSVRPVPSQSMKDIPPDLDEVVVRALATNKSDRIASAASFASQLRAAFPALQEHSAARHLPPVVGGLLGRHQPPKTYFVPLDIVSRVPRVTSLVPSAAQHLSPSEMAGSEPTSIVFSHSIEAPRYWIRPRGASALGPYTLPDFLRWFEHGSRPEQSMHDEVSADGQTWLNVSTFAELAGVSSINPVPPAEPDRDRSWSADTSHHSTLAVFTALTRSCASGKLVLEATSSEFAGTSWTIEVRRGKPLSVGVSNQKLHLPQLLLQDSQFPPLLLSEAIQNVLIHQQPLLTYLARISSHDEQVVRQMVTGRCLAPVLHLGDTQLHFRAGPTPSYSRPLADSLLAIVPHAVPKSLTTEQMRTFVLKRAEDNWRPCTDYEHLIREFHFTSDMFAIAQKLSRGLPITHFFEDDDPRVRRARCTVAYLLIQAELLQSRKLATSSD